MHATWFSLNARKFQSACLLGITLTLLHALQARLGWCLCGFETIKQRSRKFLSFGPQPTGPLCVVNNTAEIYEFPISGNERGKLNRIILNVDIPR